jgi:hypothetical protein
MQNANKKSPPDIYENQAAQALLSKFLDGEITVLEPTHDPKTGYHYSAVEAIIKDASKVEPILQALVNDKLLEQNLFDKVIYCPSCGSTGISFRYCCPICKSFNIKKSSLIEHVRCGYMDLEENFHKGTVSLVCPKCHEELKQPDKDYRKAGIWCACKECGKNFDIPLTQHLCTQCHAISTFEDSVIKDVYSYTLSDAAKNKMSSTTFLIGPIRELLESDGFKVESPSSLSGKSGAKHIFNLSGRDPKTSKVIVIDLATSNEGLVTEQPVITLFAKTFDVSPSKAFLVAIPKLSENARKMAELYNIKTIDAANQTEAIVALRQVLKK